MASIFHCRCGLLLLWVEVVQTSCERELLAILFYDNLTLSFFPMFIEIQL